MRKVGLKDELDVGRWIAEKLHGEQNEVSQNVIKFIEGKENDKYLGVQQGKYAQFCISIFTYK